MQMQEMVIDSVRVSLNDDQRVVVLRVKDTDRYLPIWMGPNDADAIAIKLQDVAVSRPLTHDLFCSAIGALGARISGVAISDLSDDVFYAKVILDLNGSSIELDCRPSDAIAVAVRSEAPIVADESVLQKASVRMDAETGKPIASDE